MGSKERDERLQLCDAFSYTTPSIPATRVPVSKGLQISRVADSRVKRENERKCVNLVTLTTSYSLQDSLISQPRIAVCPAHGLSPSAACCKLQRMCLSINSLAWLEQAKLFLQFSVHTAWGQVSWVYQLYLHINERWQYPTI